MAATFKETLYTSLNEARKRMELMHKEGTGSAYYAVMTLNRPFREKFPVWVETRLKDIVDHTVAVLGRKRKVKELLLAHSLSYLYTLSETIDDSTCYDSIAETVAKAMANFEDEYS